MEQFVERLDPILLLFRSKTMEIMEIIGIRMHLK